MSTVTIGLAYKEESYITETPIKEVNQSDSVTMGDFIPSYINL